MATNIVMTRNANVVIPITKASVSAGDVVQVGDQGLIGLAITDTYVASSYDSESSKAPPQGLADGEVSIELPGISTAVKLTVAGSPDVGDAVYIKVSDGTYIANTATNNKFIGWYLGSTYGVGLAQFVPDPA